MEGINHLIKLNRTEVKIDETKIDLFDQYDRPIFEWKPSVNLTSFSELRQVYLDIETTGLDSQKNRVILIGMMFADGSYEIIEHDSESIMLLKMCDILSKYAPHIINIYNGFSFDIPFLIERGKKYNITLPFRVSERVTTHRSAQLFGKPMQYKSIWYCGKYGQETAIIDQYHQVLAWDFVSRKLTKYTLKQAALQMGLRKESRLELSYEQMMECWHHNDLNKLREYLVYDLEDTKLISDRLNPSIYYQKLFLSDWHLQSLATGGNGSKWNSILEKEVGAKPDYDRVMNYEGGLTGGKAGLFRNVSKIDVASLYPSIMLVYGVYSCKDKEAKLLQILAYLTTERLRLKKLAKQGDEQANQMQGALKILINSAYGFLGTMGLGFNDYKAAAKVTAYGRAILRLMLKTIEANGGTPVSWDTDGVIYACPDGQNEAIHEATQAAMPQGINLDFEWTAKAIYVPPADNFGNGLRKNYLIFHNDDSVTRKGKFRKRDVCKLEKDFPVEYLKRVLDNQFQADKYYFELRQKITKKGLSIDDIKIERKIKKNEKTLVELGFGQPGDKTWYYQGLTNYTQSGGYSIYYYLNLIKNMRDEMFFTLYPDHKPKQLSLSI